MAKLFYRWRHGARVRHLIFIDRIQGLIRRRSVKSSDWRLYSRRKGEYFGVN